MRLVDYITAAQAAMWAFRELHNAVWWVGGRAGEGEIENKQYSNNLILLLRLLPFIYLPLFKCTHNSIIPDPTLICILHSPFFLVPRIYYRKGTGGVGWW